MAKRPRIVTVTVHGMRGEGVNKSEAKSDAIRRLEAATDGSYTPEIIAYRGYAILVCRDLAGWGYSIIADADTGIRSGSIYVTTGDKSFAAVKRSACNHIAQLGWQPEDGWHAPELIVNEAERRDFETWAKWQMRHAYAMRVMGFGRDQAWNWASAHGDIIEPEMLAPAAVVA